MQHKLKVNNILPMRSAIVNDGKVIRGFLKRSNVGHFISPTNIHILLMN